MFFGYFTLFVALVISTVAEFYSIVGLMAIFAAAPIPVAIMGAALGVGKVTAAVWLKLNWARAKWTYKVYLIPAVALLMALTSMGIFGFLSKAHSDQSLVSGDVQSKIAIVDEKIKTAKENIESNRRQLKQMDEAVDQVMARSTSEEGATKSNNIRRSQQRDRAALAKDIEAQQKLIARLNDEAAPIRAEVRKVEAEVGPIKYIAAMIYGDNPDANLLESAVRWVIILIVIVFDPLALVLILAGQQSIRWGKDERLAAEEPPQDEQGSDSAENINVIKDDLPPAPPVEPVGKESSILDKHPYLTQPFENFKNLKPMVYKPEETVVEIDPAPVGWMFDKTETKKPIKKKRVKKNKVVNKSPNAPGLDASIERPGDYLNPPADNTPEIYYEDLGNGYVIVEGKSIAMDALRGIYPDVWKLIQEAKTQAHSTFGTEFPSKPNKGDMFLNVALLPSKLFKFNGSRWIEVDKSLADSYTYNEDYLQYLIAKINQGHLSPDDLTDSEQEQIREYLKNNG